MATGSLGTDSLEDCKAATLTHLIAGNPQAVQDLQRLEAEGKLTPDVQAALDKLSSQPLAAGIDRAELVGTALRNLADPTSITQGDRETCAAAVVQIALAKENPAEYLRLVGGLASPEGKATLANGQTIERDANWNVASGRSIVDNLMQPAFTRFAAEDYDSLTDSRTKVSGKGLYADEQDKLANAILGKGSVSVFGSGPEVLNQLKAATGDGQSVSAILKVTDPETGKVKGHSVLVEKVQDGQVTYVDPHEGRKTVSLAEFQKQLQSVSLPKPYVTPGLKQATMSDRGLLAGGFFRRLTRAVSKVAKGVTKVVHKVGTLAMKPMVKLEESLGIHGPASAMQKGMDQMYKVANKLIDKAEQLANKVADALKKFWDKYGSYVMMVAQIVCYVVPGLQGVGVALTYAQMAMAAQQAYQGIKTGNWKMAAMGVVSAVAAGASGVVAMGSKVVGNAAVATAQTVSKVATIAQKVVGAVDAIQNKNYGALATLAVSTVKGVANFVGEGASGIAAKVGEFGEKALDYSQKAQAVYTTFKNGDKAGAAAAALSLFGQASQDAGGSEQVSNLANKAGSYIAAADKVYQAAKTKDFGAAANAAMALTGTAANDLGAGAETKATLDKAGQFVNRYAGDASELIEALGQGDRQAALTAGLSLASKGALDAGADPATVQKAQALASGAQALKQTLDSRDYLGAAQVVNSMAVDAKVLDTAQGETNEKWLTRASELQNAQKQGDYATVAKLAGQTAADLGVVSQAQADKLAPNLAKGMDLYAAARQGDKMAAAKLGLAAAGGALVATGAIGKETIEKGQAIANKFTPLQEAIQNRDYAGAAEVAARLGYEAGVLSTEQMSAIAKGGALAAKGSAVATASVATKNSVEKVLERPDAVANASPEQVAKAQADFGRLQEAFKTGDAGSLAEAASRFAASLEGLSA